MIYVEERYADKGKATAKIVSEEYVKQNVYYDGYEECNDKCDLYITGFATAEEAYKHITDVKNA